jgi:hypothetical protein
MTHEEKVDLALLFLYWCNKLEEGGYVSGGPKITTKGFDRAMDLIESGVKIDDDFCEQCCHLYETDELIIPLIMEIQEVGLEGMKEIERRIAEKAASLGIEMVRDDEDKKEEEE